MNKQADVDLGDNLTQAAEALAGDTPAQARAPKKAAAKAAPAVEPKVRIMLEDNDQIPPGGQFIGVNGKSYLLQAGVEVDVPRSVCDVLDHAVMSVPVKNKLDQVIGYRDRLRLPYRVITDSRRAA